ncbi:MAG: translational GTPase TypA [Candidatus Enterosoma sp.]|nr:translational GTPase TypA [bacterium]MDY3080762.1 translational GTPase TypA [Candidatus Enterosoma sp.]MDY4549889.1 translational GTPase TypA [Candidatus Enterosoma sp.]
MNEQIRNVAIIAHVDHGKTTLVDALLKCSNTFRDNEKVMVRALDSNPLEHERGITILAKTTAINYNGVKINIVDTPGHADFSGEVERIMNMVDGVCLLVDAFDGPMPQTRFVLKQAITYRLKTVVVINKVDRPGADPERALNEVLELFMDLGADDSQLDFPVVYTSALNMTSSYSSDPADQKEGMEPLFDTILKAIPAPKAKEDEPLQFQPSLLDYNRYVGRIGIGRIDRGKIQLGDNLVCMRLDGSTTSFKVSKLFSYRGLDRIEVDSVQSGDICGISGLPDIMVGETVCPPSCLEALPPLRIDEPTMKMSFGANTSPFSGKEGTLLTAQKIYERLYEESQKDVSMKFENAANNESFVVTGRGELHLSVLIETMRREGFEIQVSKPMVITKVIDGVEYEPFEDLQIDVPDEYSGAVMQLVGGRGAETVNVSSENGQTRLVYIVPSRGLISFMNQFMTLTKGYGIINHSFREYRPKLNRAIGQRQAGVLVSTDNGKSTAYAIKSTEERGTMFIGPGVDVYEGMIVGENKYQNDLAVNVSKAKNLTNERSSNKDVTVVLKSPRRMSLEDCLDYVNNDELVEVTPKSIRMRKKILNTDLRKKYEAHHPEEYAK